MICEVCGNDFEAGRSDTRFCSDECRNDHHATKRRIARAEARARDALYALAEATGHPSAGRLSVNTLQHLQRIMNSFNWECVECGQKRFDMPTREDRCAFCNGKKWQWVGAITYQDE